MRAPKTKDEGNAIYQDGLLGNKLRTWHSIEEAESDRSYHGCFSVRYRGRITDKKWFAHNVEAQDLSKVAGLWVFEGADYERIHVNEAPDDSRITLNAEVYRDHEGWSLRYCTLPNLSCRAAMTHPERKNANGLIALAILRHYLDTPSFENLMRLFDEYDTGRDFEGPVVEISVYEGPIGLLGWNTVFWELRDY